MCGVGLIVGFSECYKKRWKQPPNSNVGKVWVEALYSDPTSILFEAYCPLKLTSVKALTVLKTWDKNLGEEK